MDLQPIEVTNGGNWGKFAVGRPGNAEWQWRSGVGSTRMSLLTQLGWGREHVWVLDLQTGEGAFFRPGGSASADLMRHEIWVCPMFEPFLTWLYQQDLSDLSALPRMVELPEAPFDLQGYRRPGPVSVMENDIVSTHETGSPAWYRDAASQLTEKLKAILGAEIVNGRTEGITWEAGDEGMGSSASD